MAFSGLNILDGRFDEAWRSLAKSFLKSTVPEVGSAAYNCTDSLSALDKASNGVSGSSMSLLRLLRGIKSGRYTLP